MARLGDYIEQIRGVSYKPEDVCSSNDYDAVAILRANNIQDDGLVFDDLVYVKKNKVSEKQYIQKGDIIVCASSGSKNLVGKAAIATEDMYISFGAFCKVVRPKKLSPSYVGHYFQSPKYRSTISELAGGANINNIRNEHIDELSIEVVPEKEQIRIINELDKVSNLISLRKQQLLKLDELVKSRFVELFGNCKTYAGFEECIEIKDNLRKPISSEERAKMQDGTLYPYYGATGQVGWINAYLSDFEGICIAEDCGNYAVGEASSYIVRGRIWVNNHAHLLKCRENTNIYFLNEYFRQADLMDYVNGATRLKLTQSAMKTIPILFPPLELQNEFAAFVEQVDKSKLAIQKSLEKLEILKKSLMQQYFG